MCSLVVQFAHILVPHSLCAYRQQLVEYHILLFPFNEPRTEATMLSMTFLTLTFLFLTLASMLASVDWVLATSIFLSSLSLLPSAANAFGPVSSSIVSFSSQLATLFAALIASRPRPFWLLLADAPRPNLLLFSFVLPWQHQTCVCCKSVDAFIILFACNWDSAVHWYKKGRNSDHHFEAQLYHRTSLGCQVYWKESYRAETHSELYFGNYPGLLIFCL